MVIDSVKNIAQKEQLEVCLEFAEGNFANYCQGIKDRFNFWPARCTKSYKDKALPFFKAFIEVIQESNADTDGLVIGDFEDVDETKLVGKKVGIVVGEREYDGNDGTRKKGLDWYNAQFVTVKAIRSGSFEIPELRIIGNAPATTESAGVVDMSASFGPVSDDEMPF